MRTSVFGPSKMSVRSRLPQNFNVDRAGLSGAIGAVDGSMTIAVVTKRKIG